MILRSPESAREDKSISKGEPHARSIVLLIIASASSRDRTSRPAAAFSTMTFFLPKLLRVFNNNDDEQDEEEVLAYPEEAADVFSVTNVPLIKDDLDVMSTSYHSFDSSRLSKNNSHKPKSHSSDQPRSVPVSLIGRRWYKSPPQFANLSLEKVRVKLP